MVSVMFSGQGKSQDVGVKMRTLYFRLNRFSFQAEREIKEGLLRKWPVIAATTGSDNPFCRCPWYGSAVQTSSYIAIRTTWIKKCHTPLTPLQPSTLKRDDDLARFKKKKYLQSNQTSNKLSNKTSKLKKKKSRSVKYPSELQLFAHFCHASICLYWALKWRSSAEIGQWVQMPLFVSMWMACCLVTMLCCVKGVLKNVDSTPVCYRASRLLILYLRTNSWIRACKFLIWKGNVIRAQMWYFLKVHLFTPFFIRMQRNLLTIQFGIWSWRLWSMHCLFSRPYRECGKWWKLTCKNPEMINHNFVQTDKLTCLSFVFKVLSNARLFLENLIK